MPPDLRSRGHKNEITYLKYLLTSLIMKLLITQQILSPEADALCHQYIHAMKKMERNAKCRDKYAKKIKNLESSVAESAKRLCCKILRYEGKQIWELKHFLQTS